MPESEKPMAWVGSEPREFDTDAQMLDWLRAQGRHFPRLFLCVALLRPGATQALAAIEDALYPPGPEADDFHVGCLTFCQMPYAVASVPARDRGAVEAFLAASSPAMRLNDGEPHAFHVAGQGGAVDRTLFVHAAWRAGTEAERETDLVELRRFPLLGPDVRTVEYRHKTPGSHFAGMYTVPGEEAPRA